MGIAGVVAGSLVQRTKEIGVRTTLDAQPRGVLGTVVSRGVAWTLTALGTGRVRVVGFAGHPASRRQAPRRMLLGGSRCGYVVEPLGASCLPARSAALVDPVTALRCD